jgi:hypothetical protein
MLPWYASVEDVKAAPDWKESARNTAQIRRALESSSRNVEQLCHRVFYPEHDTRYWDWPVAGRTSTYRLWLDQHEVISLDTLVAGGVTIATGDYLLEPVNDGPPHDRIEINLGANAAFESGPVTFQRSIAGTGLYGYTNDTDPAGTLAAAVSSTTATTVDVTDSSQDTGVGIGNLLLIDSERLVVTNKTMISTGQTLGGSGLTSNKAAVTVPVSDGTAYALGETLLIDSERMLIVDIAGNNLTVIRAHDGTVLAAHSTGATVYAPRRLTVTRGALGTTAATHTISTVVYRHAFPGLVRELVLAETLVTVFQASSVYSQFSVSGNLNKKVSAPEVMLADLRARCYRAHGRQARIRAV